MSNYSFSDAAIRDLDEICEYIARSSPKAASKLFDDIRSKCKLVASFPNMGKSYGRLAPNLRGFVVDDYIIFYYPREDGISITRVASGYQDLEALFVD
ncbi:type II toxin-antitoxin system RelE/ParE family toxin [Nostoc sp. UIC 10630]|uniref:type II toxin-antitoxin system RelE/ParE family toxin n=1 Tax=Nostoc sp. UIC 10630 TaxID=2100146 RepID=UPI0013D34181|nr:type II toxin-antitoxin system RelE/ParE family toxin [Nostoc sp. UIC 10630]NEU80113.1 type II toxin-antitoxin system RelE/ParE family toxin [Nostoc sp. UIC 10630]